MLAGPGSFGTWGDVKTLPEEVPRCACGWLEFSFLDVVSDKNPTILAEMEGVI